jgi:integrase/recombinase XerD
MSGLADHAHAYLRMRRALGFTLYQHELILMDFVGYLDSLGELHITTERAVQWARQPEAATPVWWSARLSVVRVFARYLQGLDPVTEVPPNTLFPAHGHRRVPYIYSDDDIAALMAATAALQPAFRAATYRCYFGLLAATGMRRLEATGLDVSDLNSADESLLIRHGKFDRSRQIPLHPSVVAALERYLVQRDRQFPTTKCPSLFLSTRGTRLIRDNASAVFTGMVRATGTRWQSRRRPPRLHDLRHTFAVATLLGWHRDEADVDALLPTLSTYLGHDNPQSTYWYLTATPELLAMVISRLEATEVHP